MYCSRYRKSCEEALYHNCDVPSNEINTEQTGIECKNCVFCEEEKNNARTLEY